MHKVYAYMCYWNIPWHYGYSISITYIYVLVTLICVGLHIVALSADLRQFFAFILQLLFYDLIYSILFFGLNIVIVDRFLFLKNLGKFVFTEYTKQLGFHYFGNVSWNPSIIPLSIISILSSPLILSH